MTKKPQGINACSPSPCGPNSQCIPIKMKQEEAGRSRERPFHFLCHHDRVWNFDIVKRIMLWSMSQLVLAKERSGEGTGTVEVASCSCAAGYIGSIPHCILAKNCDKDRECQRSRECWKCFKWSKQAFGFESSPNKSYCTFVSQPVSQLVKQMQ